MSKIHTQIIEAEERLRQAMLRADVDMLDQLIAPELLFTTPLGKVIGKKEDLAAYQSGALRWHELIPSEQQIQHHHGIAIVSVLMHILGTYEYTPIDAFIRYTRVWSIFPDKSSQIIAGHASTILPANQRS